MIRALAAAVLAAAILTPPAASHGDGGSRGFRSKVTSVQPRVSGLEVAVRDFDDRLLVRNRAGRTVEILGYEGEPYLRFAGGKVLRNANSPATYLNEERYGGVPLPAGVSSKAEPRWEQVSGNASYEWHDHRIHWMSRTDPPRVRRNPDLAQLVFAWSVPGQIGSERLVIRGRLDYTPPPDEGFNRLLVIPIAAVGLATAGFWYLRRRRVTSDRPRP
jgi:hypothetical protein